MIDKSGSMSGSKWRRTVSATITALKQLRDKIDRFTVLLFDDDVEALFYDNMVLTNEDNREKAIKYYL